MSSNLYTTHIFNEIPSHLIYPPNLFLNLNVTISLSDEMHKLCDRKRNSVDTGVTLLFREQSSMCYTICLSQNSFRILRDVVVL